MAAIARVSRSARAGVLAAGLAACTVGASEPWGYTIDEARAAQQGNFCRTEADVEEIARIFERFGARPGYSVLAAAKNCRVEVRTFTPRAIVRRVLIARGEPNEYEIRFVRVETGDGATRYLVTTREIAGAE